MDLKKLKTLAKVLAFKQAGLPFIAVLIHIRQLFPKKEKSPDNKIEELLLNVLIGKACGEKDNKVLKEIMTIKKVYNNVHRHLLNKRQPYAPKTIKDLLMLS